MKTPLRGGTRAILPGAKIDLQLPAGCMGSAGLATPEENTRSLAGTAVPGSADQLVTVFSPLEIADGDASPSSLGTAIELDLPAETLDALTHQTPLRAHLVDDLATSAPGLGAIAFDGEFFFPVGAIGDDGSSMDFGWLPSAGESTDLDAGDGERGIGNTIRLFLGKKRGVESLDIGLREARLVTAPDDDPPLPGENSYTIPGGSEVRYRKLADNSIEKGQRIALFVHGFNSDTRWMIANPAQTLADQGVAYDKVLAYDYESLGTPILQNAQLLADALVAAGFSETDDVKLDVFAHSMGCLVARSMIEQAGGASYVDRAILAGPPNEGTRLAEARRILPWLGGLLLNQLLGPVSLLTMGQGLFSIANAAVGIDDLRPGSRFLRALNDNPEPPSVPYLIFAGKAEIPEERASIIERFINKVQGGGSELLKFIFQDRHDMVISMKSMQTLYGGAFPEDLLTSAIVPCHHYNYFDCDRVNDRLLEWVGHNS